MFCPEFKRNDLCCISEIFRMFFNIFQCHVIALRLRQGALQDSQCAALPCCIIAHTSSGRFISSLLSDHSTQLFCVAVANFTIMIMIMLLPFHSDGLGRLECK